MVKLSNEKQTIWDKFQPKLAEMNNRRHESRDGGRLSEEYTKMVEERNLEMSKVQ